MKQQIIKYISRKTNKLVKEKVPASSIMRFFNQNYFGKFFLNAIIKRKLITSLYGRIMNLKYSKKWIDDFVKKYNVSLQEYIIPKNGFDSFNEFFYRHIKPEYRPIEEGIVSPADGKLLAFETIDNYTSFFIKGKKFRLKQYFNDEKIAQKYDGGAMIIVRLAPTDYHRFHFPVSGIASKTRIINGFYHSVSPIALNGSLEKFFENKRTVCMIKTKEYGDVVYSDVGATMVGSIFQTYKEESEVKKGSEKGYFAFGGSTVILFFEKGKVKFDEDLIKNTKNKLETAVLMGEKIGTKV